MASRRNYIVIDIETSGRDITKGHEIVQLAARAINIYNLEPSDAGTFNVLIKPRTPDKADATALHVIGDLWTRANKDGLEPKVAYQSFLEYIKKVNPENKWNQKPTLVGYNIAGFDLPFILNSMIQHKCLEVKEGEVDTPWSIMTMDLMQICMALFDTDYEMNNFKLDSVCEKLGIKRNTDKHDAMEDTDLTTEIFVRCMKFLRAARKRMVIANE